MRSQEARVAHLSARGVLRLAVLLQQPAGPRVCGHLPGRLQISARPPALTAAATAATTAIAIATASATATAIANAIANAIATAIATAIAIAIDAIGKTAGAADAHPASYKPRPPSKVLHTARREAPNVWDPANVLCPPEHGATHARLDPHRRER